MDIAALSVSMKQNSLSQQVGISVLKKAMNVENENGEALTKMMESSVSPTLGNNIDVKA